MITISQTYKSGKRLLIHCLSEIVKQSTGQFLYASELVSERDQYPFFTFLTVIGDHEELSDFPDHRIYQIVLQLDAHSNDYWQADELAQQLHDSLHDVGYKRFLRQCSITAQMVDDVMSHNAVIGSNYDYAQGFDVTFDLVSGLEFDIDKLNFTYSPTTTIDSATITDKNDGYEIKNNK